MFKSKFLRPQSASELARIEEENDASPGPQGWEHTKEAQDAKRKAAKAVEAINSALNDLAGGEYPPGEHLTEKKKGPFTAIVHKDKCGSCGDTEGYHWHSCQTNPKDALGIKKVPLGLLPAAARIYGAEAMRHGAEKYGPYNWREKAIKMTIYLDAIERHLLALRDGQDTDADSGVHHCGHIIACAAIILDAKDTNNLIEDNHHDGPAATELAAFDRTDRGEAQDRLIPRMVPK